MNFSEQVKNNIENQGADLNLSTRSVEWIRDSARHGYSYNFSWLGRPIIQYPQDIVAMQELIWSIKPDLIIETGIAHGGSLIFSASMLALLDLSESIGSECVIDRTTSSRKVLGIDIDIRAHNRAAIESHPMASYIQMLQGSSIDPEIIEKVQHEATTHTNIMVFLDSNHTHNHVLAELRAYGPLVTVGSYCVVFDTIIEDLPIDSFPDRPWKKGNNPKTAVWEYMEHNCDFQIDRIIQEKLLITVAPDGFLKRIEPSTT